jgi:hypothetical protein
MSPNPITALHDVHFERVENLTRKLIQRWKEPGFHKATCCLENTIAISARSQADGADTRPKLLE